MTDGALDALLDDVWRQESPFVLAALLRRHGDLADCEDAAQEALVAAAVQWLRDGVPDHPRGWLLTVASRRLVAALVLPPRSFRRPGRRRGIVRRAVALARLVVDLGLRRRRGQPDGRGDLHHGRHALPWRHLPQR